MKKILALLSFLAVLLQFNTVYAHAIWLETNPTGTKGKKQIIQVYFGEYSYSLKEKTEDKAFEKVKNFTLWLVDPKGVKTILETAQTDTSFIAEFTPQSDGIYTVMLNNSNIEVIDYTQYNFGIFKTHYHAVAKIQVGKKTEAPTVAENAEGITLVDQTGKDGKTTLQVLYKGQPLSNADVEISLPEQWNKKIKTDEKGIVTFNMPWNARYLVEVTQKEEVPGVYNEKEYQFIWHCVTYSIKSN